MNTPAPPATAETFQIRRTNFNRGKAVNQYMVHLQQATILLNQHKVWMDPAVRAVGKGLWIAQDVGFKSPNIISSAELINVIGCAILGSSQGLAYCISYLFARRRPSQAPELPR